MGQITSLFVHKVVNAAYPDTAADVTAREALFRSVGIDPQAAVDPRIMVDAAAYYDLCERVTREHPLGSGLPVRVGGSMRCDDYGAFGLAWKTATTLRGSFTRAERYWLVLTSVSAYELQSEGDRHFMTLNRAGERHLGLRLSNEQTVAAIVAISREVSTDGFDPVAVHFRHPAPDDISAHEAYFASPVQFGADRDAVEVSTAMLDAPTRLGDAAVTQFLEAQLDRDLEALDTAGALARRTRAAIARGLSEGLPHVSEIAGGMAMSARTLQRRLADEGHSFQELVDQARRELAQKLLRDSDYSLADVAFLTGFSEQSAFTRAFKRWEGQTPRSYRLGG